CEGARVRRDVRNRLYVPTKNKGDNREGCAKVRCTHDNDRPMQASRMGAAQSALCPRARHCTGATGLGTGGSLFGCWHLAIVRSSSANLLSSVLVIFRSAINAAYRGYWRCIS